MTNASFRIGNNKKIHQTKLLKMSDKKVAGYANKTMFFS
jgi:hypothetical protein